MRHQIEPRNPVTEDRPDIVVFDPEASKNEELYIALAHPWRKDSVKKAARENGYAAATRGKWKKSEVKSRELTGWIMSRVHSCCV